MWRFIDIHKFIVKILTHPQSDLKDLARNEFKRWMDLICAVIYSLKIYFLPYIHDIKVF